MPMAVMVAPCHHVSPRGIVRKKPRPPSGLLSFVVTAARGIGSQDPGQEGAWALARLNKPWLVFWPGCAMVNAVIIPCDHPFGLKAPVALAGAFS